MSINLETALWLDGSLNLETFEDSAFNPAEDKDVMENLKISIGVGTILAVNKPQASAGDCENISAKSFLPLFFKPQEIPAAKNPFGWVMLANSFILTLAFP